MSEETPVEVTIQLDGLEATEQTTHALQSWLQQERIAGLRVEPKRGVPKQGELGLEPLTILSIILGSRVVVELVKSIHTWIKTRKPKVQLKVKVGNAEVTVDAENVDDQEVFVRNILSSLQRDKLVR